MREKQFPFPKFRDYGPTPTILPEVDETAVAKLSYWQGKIGNKGVIYDDITGYWQFAPYKKDVIQYTTSPMHKTLGTFQTDDEDLNGRRDRMPVHVAESAEVAISSFVTIAQMRRKVLRASFSHGLNEDEVDLDLSDELANYTCEAITDYGYCLANPVSTGWLHETAERKEVDENWLSQKINSFSPKLGRQILDFGLYALNDKSQLITADGLVIIDATLGEQERRLDVWGKRYRALTDAYPEIKTSIEAVGSLSLEQIFDIQADFPRAC